MKGGGKMKKNILGIFVFSLIVLGMSFSSAISYDNSDETANMTVKVNVLPTTISISVPDNIVFDDIAAGYLSELQSFSVINSGTTDIQVMPNLGTSTDDGLFSNIAFKRVQTDDPTKIGFFDLEIEKPSTVGETRDQNVYMQLDLTDYSGEITGNNNATVIFTAVPL